jgi:hypothetical protein
MADIKKFLAVFDHVELTDSQNSLVRSSDFQPESLHTDSFDSNDLKHRDKKDLFKKE